MAQREYPVGKVQSIVLEALGLKANSFQHADRLFNQRSISVSSKRVGRSYVPVIKKFVGVVTGSSMDDTYSGETYQTIALTDEQRTAIAQWME